FAGINVADVDLGAEAAREAIRNMHAPDVELRTLASGLGSGVGTHYRGLDGIVRYLHEWLEPFSEYRVENLDYIDDHDCVLVPSRQWGIGAGSGVRVESERTTLYDLRCRRLAASCQYDSLA